ncbi:DUF4148 domain-containing protein [Burkholderia sp. L27(2015)]|jgi:hypothetical protein|uniref:DUF4148 domain-containing protein n=1 Tax=Burkholderia sp. L27(2015) TaxID=1641858 RepID=UPI0020B173F6|nr:DUF4148 domain-containing protein [Burkholderia sp. L27(2015)]
MKRALLTAALFAVSTLAVAQTSNLAVSVPVNPNVSYDAAPAGKTRAQVMQELVQAEKAGLVPSTEANYPPSDDAVRLNRARYAVQENWFDHHSVN